MQTSKHSNYVESVLYSLFGPSVTNVRVAGRVQQRTYL